MLPSPSTPAPITQGYGGVWFIRATDQTRGHSFNKMICKFPIDIYARIPVLPPVIALVFYISIMVEVILDPCYKNVPIWHFNKSSTTCNRAKPGIVGGVGK